jgi:hypothetical protein
MFKKFFEFMYLALLASSASAARLSRSYGDQVNAAFCETIEKSDGLETNTSALAGNRIASTASRIWLSFTASAVARYVQGRGSDDSV